MVEFLRLSSIPIIYLSLMNLIGHYFSFPNSKSIPPEITLRFWYLEKPNAPSSLVSLRLVA